MFLINYTLYRNDQWLHCQEQFPAAASQNAIKKIGIEKCFDAAGAYSIDAKVTLPGQTGLAWVQLLPHQNYKIVCHLAELDGIQNFVEDADVISV